jgi:hypothetical protein
MLQIRFYNRRLLASTRAKNTLFGDRPPSAVEKPRRRSASRSSSKRGVAAVVRGRRRTTSRSSGLQRLRALTARRRLRTGRLSRMRFRAARGERGSFFGYVTLRRPSPLAPPGRLKRATRERSSFPSLISMPRAARQCCPLPEIEAPSAGEVQNERPREHPPGALHPLADGRSCCTCSSMFKKLRLDRSSAPLSRAFPGRVRFHDFCRSMFQRALPWTARTSRTSGIVVGTAADSIDRCLSIGGDRRGYAGSGAEDHRASALPPGTAPESDFAPTPIASDTSCRGHCPSPCQELTRGDGQSRRRRAR